jgi:hypothetical protein
MNKCLFIISLATASLASIAQASVFDPITPNTSVCRNALINLMGETPSNSKVNFTKILDGTDSEGSACTLKISLYETNDSQKGLLTVTGKYLNPFNHSIDVENLKGCDNNAQAVKGFHTFKQDSGWYHRFTSKVNITKLAENGKIEVIVRQEGYTKTCTGEIK